MRGSCTLFLPTLRVFDCKTRTRLLDFIPTLTWKFHPPLSMIRYWTDLGVTRAKPATFDPIVDPC